MHPSFTDERRHKKKRLVQSPNSYFLDVKCMGKSELQFHTLLDISSTLTCVITKAGLFLHFSGCYRITTVFSHSQTVVPCAGCSIILCHPRGGKCRLTTGCSFRRKHS
uniref:40S ribosomal protein S27-like n=1 Tax=Cynoglossus semilaevis TaxID=244447 RepID=A0A3P8X224_CYNSE